MPQSPYTLTRSEAADQIGISLRTLDRYLKQGKIDYIRTSDRTRQIRVNRLSVLDFVDTLSTATPKQKTPTKQSRGVDKPVDKPVDKKPTLSTSIPPEKTPTQIYQNLYEETRHKLDEANRRLEGANYRVGELEAQLKNTVPLLEHQATTAKVNQLETKVQKLHHEVTESALTNYRLTTDVNQARQTASFERQKRFFYTALLLVFVVLSTILFSLMS